jgi:hypothetical protein
VFPLAPASASRAVFMRGLSAERGRADHIFSGPQAKSYLPRPTAFPQPRPTFLEPSCPKTFGSFSDILNMDSLSALSVAGSILAVVEFRTELLPTSKQSQGETLINQREEYLSFILERLRTLRLKLSTVYISAKQQVSAGASQPLSDVIALQELALSCIEDSGKLLDNLVKIQRDFPGSGDSQVSVDAKSWFASLLGGRVDEAKREQLSRAVAVHIRCIVRCATLLFEVTAIQ